MSQPDNIVLKKITLLGSFLLIVFSASQAYSEESLTYKTFLTTDPKIQKNSNTFDCNDKIYITSQFTNITKGTHTLKAIWINPSNEIEQTASHNFEATKTVYHGWLWIKLHSPMGGSIFGDLNPNQGMAKYVGFWTVHFYLDDKKIASKTFQINC